MRRSERHLVQRKRRTTVCRTYGTQLLKDEWEHEPQRGPASTGDKVLGRAPLLGFEVSTVQRLRKFKLNGNSQSVVWQGARLW